MEMDLRLNTAGFERALHLAPKNLKYEIGDALDHISRKFLKRFKAERLQGPPGVRGSNRGIFTHFKRVFNVAPEIDDMGVVIFSDSKIARLQEEGGIVRAPGGGKIAVPLSFQTDMFTAQGKLKARFKQIRNLKNIVAIKLSGKVFLAQAKKKSRDRKFRYVLKDEVEIKPRLGFYNLWESMGNESYAILNRSIDKALRK
jgi:hypothetical protein